jgi:hypothetical protein
MIFILKKYRYGFSGNYKIEDDFTLIRFQNDGIENFNAQREVSSGLIQFHFGLKGSQFILQPGNYALELKEENHCFCTIHKKNCL